ncbi:MAG TPA: hypothetical protein VF733_03760 [Candidatus Saccharimonadales bacterium]
MAAENVDDIVFEPCQIEAFKEWFRTASPDYRPDGRSFWQRVIAVNFSVTCDTSAMDLPPGYMAPKTTLAGNFVKPPEMPEGVLSLYLHGTPGEITQDQLGYLSYSSARPADRPGISHILQTVIGAELADFAHPNTILDRLRRFPRFGLRRTQIIQKTFDPETNGIMEKNAIHLSLMRHLIHVPNQPKKGIAISQLRLGRPAVTSGEFFTYWQTLQSDPGKLTVMRPAVECFYYGTFLPTPDLGQRFEGVNPGHIGRKLESNLDGPLTGDYRYDLTAFEDRLRAFATNEHISIGALTARDAVRLIAEPLDERLRLHLD